MAQKIKITHKQATQEVEATVYLREVFKKLLEYRVPIAIGFGVLVLATAGYVVVSTMIDSAGAKKIEALSRAESIFSTPVFTEEEVANNPAIRVVYPRIFTSRDEKLAKAKDQFERVQAEYPDSREAIISEYYLGLVDKDMNKMDEAAASFQVVVEKTDKTDPFWALAQSALAAVRRSQGKSDEALTAYEALVEANADPAVTRFAQLELADLYEARGKYSDAMASLAEYMSGMDPNDPTRRQFENRIESLKRMAES
ncbi:tetratricopeptide repeat protein [bacterium]|nr:tetratricopeptide repeat protein [bacterium]